MLPAVMMVPVILLAIYLLFETTKLSREKIRNQFALDISAISEMTPLTSLLNANAYLNMMPYLVFRDEMSEPLELNKLTQMSELEPDDQNLTMYDFFYRAGAFPGARDLNEQYNWEPKPTDTEWYLTYYEDTRKEWDSDSPEKIEDQDEGVEINDQEMTQWYLVPYNEKLSKAIFSDYLQTYYLAGRAIDGQIKIYDSIQDKKHEFFRKAYYLNIGSCKQAECGQEGAAMIGSDRVAFDRMSFSKFNIHWMRELPEFLETVQKPDFDHRTLEIDRVTGGRLDELHQFVYLDKSSLKKMERMARGIDITQAFDAPGNYFNVNLDKYKPRVHAKVAVRCPAKDNNCIWPATTPKYQIFLSP